MYTISLQLRILLRARTHTETHRVSAFSQVCQVGWSGPHQGFHVHVERYRNSPVMHKSTLANELTQRGAELTGPLGDLFSPMVDKKVLDRSVFVVQHSLGE